MQAYRANMSDEKCSEARKRNVAQQKYCRLKWDDKKRKQASMQAKLRMQKMRARKREADLPASPATINVTPSKAFPSAQSLGKAMRRVKNALPASPRRQVCIIKKLAEKFTRDRQEKSSPSNSSMDETEQIVRTFYLSDEISRQQPGKKDFITVKKDGQRVKLQKKILIMTVMEAFKQFKTEFPEVKIGKSKFAALRPENVVSVTDKDQNVCCCQYHENFELLVNGIRKQKPNIPTSEALILQSVCGWNMECHLGNCDDCKDFDSLIRELFGTNDDAGIKVNYYQWNNQYHKEIVSSSVPEAEAALVEQLGIMRRHVFIAKTQLRAIKSLKGQLAEDEAVLQEDFSENYSIKQQNEVMSAHWVSMGVTLFTAVLNTSDGSSSFVIVSDELRHDKYAVTTFNRKILECANADGRIKRLHIFSDGAASQFKNRFSLSLLNWPSQIHMGLEMMDWSFFATAHGKGPVDGVGGTVKRAVWRRVLQGQTVVNSAAEVAQVAEKACPNVKVIYVTSNEVAQVRKELDELWDEHKPAFIPQLRFHHYLHTTQGSLELQAEIVSPFSSAVIATPQVAHTADIPEEASRVVGPAVPPEAESTSTATQEEKKIEPESYYAVDFIDRFYVGRILQPSNRDGFWDVKFLHQVTVDGVTSFQWPKTADIDSVHQSAIFYGPITLQGVTSFTVPNLNEIRSIFAEFWNSL